MVHHLMVPFIMVFSSGAPVEGANLRELRLELPRGREPRLLLLLLLLLRLRQALALVPRRRLQLALQLAPGSLRGGAAVRRRDVYRRSGVLAKVEKEEDSCIRVLYNCR